jgi:hypothetical protein
MPSQELDVPVRLRLFHVGVVVALVGVVLRLIR